MRVLSFKDTEITLNEIVFLVSLGFKVLVRARCSILEFGGGEKWRRSV